MKRWNCIKVCIYTWEKSKWKYCWTNIYGIAGFNSWLESARGMDRWDKGNSIEEKQEYDGSLVLILKNNGENRNKYICKVSTTNNKKERR